MQYNISATVNGKTLFLSRRQNLDRPLLGDSITTNPRNAFAWTDNEYSSYNLTDAETFRAHAEQHAAAGWTVTEAN